MHFFRPLAQVRKLVVNRRDFGKMVAPVCSEGGDAGEGVRLAAGERVADFGDGEALRVDFSRAQGAGERGSGRAVFREESQAAFAGGTDLHELVGEGGRDGSSLCE